jgi:hypothetical protein
MMKVINEGVTLPVVLKSFYIFVCHSKGKAEADMKITLFCVVVPCSLVEVY